MAAKLTFDGSALILRKNSPNKVSHLQIKIINNAIDKRIYQTYDFFISTVVSSKILKSPSKISGKYKIRSIFGTASNTDIHDIKNCRANGFFG